MSPGGVIAIAVGAGVGLGLLCVACISGTATRLGIATLRAFMDLAEALARVLQWPGTSLERRKAEIIARHVAEMRGHHPMPVEQRKDPREPLARWLDELCDGFVRYPWSIEFYEREVARHLALWSDPPPYDGTALAIKWKIGTIEGQDMKREAWPPRAIDGSYVQACALCDGPAVTLCRPNFDVICRSCTAAEIAEQGGPQRFFWTGADVPAYKGHDARRRGESRDCSGGRCPDLEARDRAQRSVEARRRSEAKERQSIEGALTTVGG